MEDYDIALRGVTAAFDGRRAVDGVSLEIRRGEFFSLLGPSGCGKTTLLRIVAGFEPHEGEVTLGSLNMAGVPPHRRDANIVFQNYALFPHLDVAGNVAFGLRMMKEEGIPSRVEAALAMVGLAGYGPRSPGTLSGGEQQRVALARAIVTGPRVLLLDEPLAALDLKLRKELRLELKRLQRALRMTFLFVTHDQEEALVMSDRVAVMNAGRIEQVGTPEEIYERPATRFIAGFVGAGNLFEGLSDGRILRTVEGLEIPSTATGGVTLLVRPEKVRLGVAGGLPALVEEVLYQGATTTVVLRAGPQRILAEGAGSRVSPGEAVTFSWDPKDAWALPR